jgi:hypothetical protein
MSNARLGPLIMLIIVAACATQPKRVAHAGPDQECHSEATTGTLITKSACSTRAQREAEQSQLDALKGAVEAGAPALPPH